MRYVGNNPVVRVDPQGTDPDCYVSQFTSTYKFPEIDSVTEDGTGGYNVLMVITRISRAQVTYKQCPCGAAPDVSAYSFYQWKKGYEVDKDAGTGKLTYVQPIWPNWVCDQSPGGQNCTYYTLPNPPVGKMVPLTNPPGCLWQFDFYTCDDPGIQGRPANCWGENCVRHPPSVPEDLYPAGIGNAGGNIWNGKQWVRNYCTGFGKSGAEALKIGAPRGIIYGFAESTTSGPNPYYDPYNAGGCPAKP